MNKLVKIYIEDIVQLHGIPVSIVSDRDSLFASWFWKSFNEVIGTTVSRSATFHPQTDGQSKRTIQMLENMLRACVIDFKGSWVDHLMLIEFS
jgi:hypothetical protein